MKPNIFNKFKDIIFLLIILIITTLINFAFNNLGFHETNIVVMYIFSVLLVSRFTKGYIYGIIASIISLLLFNWFFTEPYFTLKVNDLTYIITFAIMTLTSVLTTALTTKVKKAAEDAKLREKESNALYGMTNHLTDAEDTEAIANIIVKAVGEILNCQSAFVCFDEKGEPERSFIQLKDDNTIIHRELMDANELKQRMKNLHSGVDITEQEYVYPIYGKTDTLAVLRVPSSFGELMSESQTRMLHSIIESASLALERTRSIKEQAKSREETTQERYRGNLLRAISHDIRTPLSGIMGTSEMLMSATDKNDPRYVLSENIFKDARWLHEMVENILNLTKLQDGKLILDKQSEAVEEVIGATIITMEKRFPGRIIDVEMPENVVMAPMDARLISQVLINLLDNANKHTPQDKPITIKVLSDENNVVIAVADRGSGISNNDLPHIFKMFYTTNNKVPDSKRGVGLGLAICQSIIEAHGGTITAENRPDGGALFKFTLPLGGKK